MIRLIVLLPLTFLLLSGCFANHTNQPKVVILKHPVTLDFQNCAVSGWGNQEDFRKNEECVSQFQQQGYEIWGSR
jgi:hypothetical protein